MKPVAARFCDDADLAARARAVLRRIAARLDAELLHVLQRRLQAEGRGDFTVQVARAGVNNGRPLDAVVAYRILFHGASRKPNVTERARTAVERARRLQIELRQL